jgi:hypothetical protein
MAAGKLLERLVAALHVRDSSETKVTWNDRINGRQFDVTLRFTKGIHDYLVVIECKDYAGPVSVEKVEAFITKSADAKANKAVMISPCGFQSGASLVAGRHNVRLFTIEEMTAEELPIDGTVIKGIAFTSLSFDLPGGGGQLILPSRSPRFGYIWQQAKLKVDGARICLEDLVRKRHPTAFTTFPDPGELRTLRFKTGATLLIPHEDPVRVTAMRYGRETVDFVKPSGALPPAVQIDPWLRERFALSILIRDEDGKVVQQESLRQLPFGFDTQLIEGAFYEAPAFGFHYYLSKVTPSMLTWIAIETYQHGRLFQATYTQEPKYAQGMVAVTDSATLKRLNRMLAGYSGRAGAKST